MLPCFLRFNIFNVIHLRFDGSKRRTHRWHLWIKWRRPCVKCRRLNGSSRVIGGKAHPLRRIGGRKHLLNAHRICVLLNTNTHLTMVAFPKMGFDNGNRLKTPRLLCANVRPILWISRRCPSWPVFKIRMRERRKGRRFFRVMSNASS